MTLTSGEAAEVEVLQMELGNEVRVRLADGSEKTIPWEWIASLEMHAPPVAQAPQPEATAAPASAGAVAPEKKPAEPTQADKVQALDDEIQKIDEEMPALPGPIVLTAVGLGAGTLFMVTGAGLKSECLYSADYESCNTMTTMFMVMGGVGIAAGVGGAVWLVTRIQARKPHQAKIRELEAERDRLKMDVQAGPTGAYGTMTWSF
jgi:hypothetical protein